MIDDSISESVSLSKILDCMLTEEETPSVILNFLGMYDISVVEDMILKSTVGMRMFQLDFLGRCSDSEMFRLFGIVTELAKSYGMSENMVKFAWKVLQSNVSESTKSLFRTVPDTASGGSRMRHPYTGRIAKEISSFENVFKDVKNGPFYIAKWLSRVPKEDLSWYVSNQKNSLFFDRMLNSDIFCEMDIASQYVVIRKMPLKMEQVFDFALQIMELDVETGLKVMLYERIRSDGPNTPFFSIVKTNNVISEMYESSDGSASKLCLTMALYGKEEYARDMIRFLLFFDLDMLKAIYTIEPETIRENYDVCDFLDAISKGRTDGRDTQPS